MYKQRLSPYFQPESPAHKRAPHEWRFSAKDVGMIIGIALILSGLMGLGAVMLVEIAERFLF